MDLIAVPDIEPFCRPRAASMHGLVNQACPLSAPGGYNGSAIWAAASPG